MPLRVEDIKNMELPFSFLNKGQTQVRIGPCSASPFVEQRIPLDGRHYICSGTIILRNGTRLRSNFEINTHTFDFLERDTVTVYIDKEKAWYYFDEQELYNVLGLTREQVLPYTWLPDLPLDFHEQGPYPMTWPED